jgi:hypothetical protein
MEPKFTRGPWWVDDAPVALLIRTELDGDVDGDTGRHVVVGGQIVAQIEDCERDEANARLIAAAPELYEAAEEARLLIGARNDVLHEAQRQSNINKAWHLLNDALAKARGEQVQA